MPELDNKEAELPKDKSEGPSPKAQRKRRWPYILFVIALSFALFHLVVSMTQIKLEGKAVAVKQIEIQTVSDGILKEIHVENAQKVKKGDLLFQFQNEELDLHLLRTEEHVKELTQKRIHIQQILDHTTKMVERAKILFENGVISKAQLEETTLENSKSEAALKELDWEIKNVQLGLESLKVRKESLSIRASFDGVFLGDIEPKQNTYFKKGESLGILFDPAKFYLEAFLPETKVLDLKAGDSARVAFKGLRGIYDGRVVQMDERVTEEIEKVFKTKHVLRVLFLLDQAPEDLKPGMRGTAKIVPKASSYNRLVGKERISEKNLH